MKKILITGGAGFIGSNLACALRERGDGCEVTALDNLRRRGSELNLPRLAAAGVKFVHGDIRDPHCFPAEAPDLLIECSAEPSVMAGHGESPDYVFQANLVGAYHCLEYARQTGARFLFLSTSRVYPIAKLEAHPWEETETRFRWKDEGTPGISSRGVSEALDLTGARSLYGWTKLSAEQLIEEYRAAYGLQAIVNRCGVVAGPWQFGKVDQGVVGLWVIAHLLERPLSYIGYGGQGKQVRDLLHVADLCDLILAQIERFDDWEGWLGNVSGGLEQSVSLCELTAKCREITGKSVPIREVAATRPNDLRLFIGDSSRLFERTKWRPRRGVDELVRDVARWVVDHRTALERVL